MSEQRKTVFDELRSLAKKAAGGPWRVGKGHNIDGYNDSRIYPAGPSIDCIATMQVSNCPGWRDDAAFIVAAVNYVRAILEAEPRSFTEWWAEYDMFGDSSASFKTIKDAYAAGQESVREQMS